MSDTNITEEEDMTFLPEDDIGSALTDIMRSIDSQYETMTQEELQKKWYFTFEPSTSLRYNTYIFMQCLDLYRRSCRKWEENNNGRSMVVERVREKYLLPKIDEFLVTLREHM